VFGAQSLRNLFLHQEWADARLWEAVGRAGDSPLDPRLFSLLFHMHATQRRFLQLWRAQSSDIPDPATLQAGPALRDWARSYYRELSLWLGTVHDPDLAEHFTMPWSERLEAQFGAAPAPVTLGDTAYQVVAHSTYHRAQVNTRLRELGVTPPVLDYIAWAWLGRPWPHWPDRGPGQSSGTGQRV
jgi:uncharacterized damage-inducible protein DinB